MELSRAQQARRFRDSITIAIGLTAIMWMIKFVELGFDIRLYRWGIYPRVIDGLKGIFFSPFLHSGWAHLLSNTGPFLFLITILFYFYRTIATPVLILLYTLTGMSVWLFANNSYHIGASGVVYGLVSFVMFSGLFRRNRQAITLSLVILAVFTGYFVGIAPTTVGEKISWESHLSGAIMGFLTAYIFKGSVQVGEQAKQPAWVDEDDTLEYMFPRDLFEKTKVERFVEQLEKQESNVDNTGFPVFSV